MKIDYPVANSYFQKISSIVGKEEMEDFNNVMAEAFVFGLKQIYQLMIKIVKPFKLYFLHTNIKICMKKVDSFLSI